jgi:rRNA-processing protein FCF1
MKPKEIMTPLQSAQAYLLDAEHELAAANDRIRLLISERDTARMQADQKVSLREEFRELLGTDDIEQGVAVVREMKDRIIQLEEQLMDAKNKHAALVADVVLYEDRGERIKLLEEAGDYLDECLLSVAGENHPAKQLWRKAKEAK